MDTQYTGQSVVGGRITFYFRRLRRYGTVKVPEGDTLDQAALRVFCGKIGLPVGEVRRNTLKFISFDPATRRAVYDS